MRKMTAKAKIILWVGIGCIVVGSSLLVIFGYRRISREIKKRQLLKECIVLEIPSADIRVPVVEGIDGENLHIAAGHFVDTGSLGTGNYCIAGHNSTIYAEVFNTLEQVKVGDSIDLIAKDEPHTRYTYTVTERQIVEPTDTWILQDYGDNRVTIVSCTDDGTQRQVVVGILQETNSKDN